MVRNDKFANNVNIGSTAILLPIFIDNENMAVVESLLQQGLPEGLSAESYKTIWIVIDHASLEKQEQHLSLIVQMTLRGLVDKDNYAILFDRIAMKRNRPQRYGSQSVQFGSPGDMYLYIWPAEKAEGLDSWLTSKVWGATQKV